MSPATRIYRDQKWEKYRQKTPRPEPGTLYPCRQSFAISRPRHHGRFTKTHPAEVPISHAAYTPAVSMANSQKKRKYVKRKAVEVTAKNTTKISQAAYSPAVSLVNNKKKRKYAKCEVVEATLQNTTKKVTTKASTSQQCVKKSDSTFMRITTSFLCEDQPRPVSQWMTYDFSAPILREYRELPVIFYFWPEPFELPKLTFLETSLMFL